MKFGDKLRRALALTGVSQSELSRRLDLSRSAISKWISNTNTPDIVTAGKIANALGLTIDELTMENLSRDPNPFKQQLNDVFDELNDINQKNVIDYAQTKLDEQEHPRIPLKTVPMAGYSAAGVAVEPYHADTTGEMVETDKAKADAFVILTGDSMEPRFKQGEMVFYKSQPNIENGELAIVEIDGEGAICKQVKIDYENRKIILHSLNPNYEDIVMDPKRIRILGKVIE